MTQSVPSHTGPAALIKLAQDVLNTEIAGLAAVRDRLNARTPEKAPLVLALGLLAACTGRVVVTGIGKSGLVGRKLALIQLTQGFRQEACFGKLRKALGPHDFADVELQALPQTASGMVAQEIFFRK